jgi:mono/diheme cytochrome c family protein
MPFMRGIVASMVLLAFCLQVLAQNPQTKAPPTAPAQKSAPAAPAQSQAIDRGKYLVTIMGCHDCHSPKANNEPDPKRLLSGHPANEKLLPVPAGLLGPDKWGTLANNHLTAWVGPWGVSFAANLTPDKVTGLGAWTPDMFVKALRTGKHRGDGRTILPPMPWQLYVNVTEADLRAMFAYLMTLPPINNMVPTPLPPEKIPH